MKIHQIMYKSVVYFQCWHLPLFGYQLIYISCQVHAFPDLIGTALPSRNRRDSIRPVHVDKQLRVHNWIICRCWIGFDPEYLFWLIWQPSSGHYYSNPLHFHSSCFSIFDTKGSNRNISLSLEMICRQQNREEDIFIGINDTTIIFRTQSRRLHWPSLCGSAFRASLTILLYLSLSNNCVEYKGSIQLSTL